MAERRHSSYYFQNKLNSYVYERTQTKVLLTNALSCSSWQTMSVWAQICDSGQFVSYSSLGGNRLRLAVNRSACYHSITCKKKAYCDIYNNKKMHKQGVPHQPGYLVPVMWYWCVMGMVLSRAQLTSKVMNLVIYQIW